MGGAGSKCGGRWVGVADARTEVGNACEGDVANAGSAVAAPWGSVCGSVLCVRRVQGGCEAGLGASYVARLG